MSTLSPPVSFEREIIAESELTSISGHIYTPQTAVVLDTNPELGTKWANSNPLGRLGARHEVRGVVAWLASDASTFCTG